MDKLNKYMRSFEGILKVQYIGQNNHIKTTKNFCGYDQEKLGMKIPANREQIFDRIHNQSNIISWLVAKDFVGYNVRHGSSTHFISLYTPIETGDTPRKIWYVPQINELM